MDTYPRLVHELPVYREAERLRWQAASYKEFAKKDPSCPSKYARWARETEAESDALFDAIPEEELAAIAAHHAAEDVFFATGKRSACSLRGPHGCAYCSSRARCKKEVA